MRCRCASGDNTQKLAGGYNHHRIHPLLQRQSDGLQIYRPNCVGGLCLSDKHPPECPPPLTTGAEVSMISDESTMGFAVTLSVWQSFRSDAIRQISQQRDPPEIAQLIDDEFAYIDRPVFKFQRRQYLRESTSPILENTIQNQGMRNARPGPVPHPRDVKSEPVAAALPAPRCAQIADQRPPERAASGSRGKQIERNSPPASLRAEVRIPRFGGV